MSDYKTYFSTKTDYELVNIFNIETSHSGWVSQRAIFLSNLFQTFRARHIALDQIEGDLEGLKTYSLKYPVFLDERDGKKILIQIIKNHSKEQTS